jgi:allantoin racemase
MSTNQRIKTNIPVALVDTSVRTFLIVNPNTSSSFTSKIEAISDNFATSATRFIVVNPSTGPRSIEGRRRVEVANASGVFDEILSSAPTLEVILQYAQEVDGIILACFSAHPVIQAAREVLTVPVVGIMEASCYMALALGHKFSVVTTNDRWVPLLQDGIKQCGLLSRCASVRSTSMAVLALEEDNEEIVTRYL